jgi:hypothetical protein
MGPTAQSRGFARWKMVPGGTLSFRGIYINAGDTASSYRAFPLTLTDKSPKLLLLKRLLIT